MTDVDAVNFFRDDEMIADPYPYYEALRGECPVRREPHENVVMITGYEEATAVFNDTTTFSSCTSVTGPFPGFPVPLDEYADGDIADLIAEHRDSLPMSDQLPTLDPPMHTDHRGLLMRLITPKRLKENEDFMWRLADRQLDTFIDRGSCEFINDFASPFAMLVIADLLGVPEEDHERFEEALLHRPTGGGVGSTSTRRWRIRRSSTSTRSSPTYIEDRRGVTARRRADRAGHRHVPRRLDARGDRRRARGGQPVRRRPGDDGPAARFRGAADRRGRRAAADSCATIAS